MEKCYALLGQNPNTNELVLLASWSKLPSQSVIDTLLDKLSNTYSRFVLTEDILFIEGRGEPDTQDWLG